jgi:DNA-binding NarL/FixJ family response regulator
MRMVAERTNGARAKGQAEPARKESRASRTAETPAACDYSGLVTTFLVVDDHPSFRRTARVLLESEGFEVVGEAADGASAIQAATSLRPDVVLLDVYLPDINGFEVAKKLMANGDSPVIVLTSSRDPRDFGALVEQSGAKGFISKAELSGASLTALLE